MRLIICLIPLLCGCATPAVRCDSNMQPINPPAASGGAHGDASGASSGTAKATTSRRTP
jgi:hypothetical protein